MGPEDEPRGAVGRRVWEKFAGRLVGPGQPELLGDLCRAVDEQAALMVAVRRGDASAGERAALRVLDARVEELRSQVVRAAAWAELSEVSGG